MGIGPGIGSAGTGNGGCSGGIGTSGGIWGVCGPILILVLVLVLERLAGMKRRLSLSNVIMDYSIRRQRTPLFEHEDEPEHENDYHCLAQTLDTEHAVGINKLRTVLFE